MRLYNIRKNMNVVTLGDWDILFSYDRPVAAHSRVEGYFKTCEKFSRTTSRHINEWIGKDTPAKVMSQEWFECLSQTGNG